MAKTKMFESNQPSSHQSIEKINYTLNQLKHKTMKNENKCFFSISLENGITITGTNPYEVRDFLIEMQEAASDCKKAAKERGHNATSRKMDQLEKELNRAYITITNNLNK